MESLGCSLSSYLETDQIKNPAVKYILIDTPQEKLEGTVSIVIENLGNQLDMRPIAVGTSVRAEIYKNGEVNNKIAIGSYTYTELVQIIDSPAQVAEDTTFLTRSDLDFDRNVDVKLKFVSQTKVEAGSKLAIQLAVTQFVNYTSSIKCEMNGQELDCDLKESEEGFMLLETGFNLPYITVEQQMIFKIEDSLKNPIEANRDTQPISFSIFQKDSSG